MDKAPDAFRTISEAAEELNVPQHVLRFWETRFAQIKPMKRAGGRRYYRPADVELLKGIRGLLYNEGYTIRGVQKILKEEGAAYVCGIGRGEIVPRKRDLLEAEAAPAPGTAKTAPRVGIPPPGKAPLARPGGAAEETVRIVTRLADGHIENLKVALRDLGDARRLLDPGAR
ncbi:MAG: MerR family transcriptional regulator [Rhizobiales bacterium]|nr:MerR family transcriptional regulator [Hyphomicrobiales bacterium]MBI3671884.1 MerR family transcriptional regulator [Hyphomicrobiales bacterium]